MSLPKLTPEEKRRALAKAQEMRSRRAQLRRELKSGAITLAEVLAREDDEAVQKMRVSYLLQSLPHVGKVTTDKVMQDIGIHENRRVQGLGPRQRTELLQRFG
ncbi:MAG: integration host factor, actinobacterial type [Limnochordales bacterium]|nr:MAG: integration host factor [Bacillota bacterium]